MASFPTLHALRLHLPPSWTRARVARHVAKRVSRPLPKVLAALLCVASTTGGAAGQGGKSGQIVRGEIAAKFDEHMSARAAAGFSGVILMAKDGQVLLSKGYGEANKEKKTPYAAATVFDIGSITKQFTAAAVLKLEMQGKLSATDLMSKYLAGVPTDKAGITIHQLLTHTAGFADSLGDDYDPIGRDEFLKLAFASPLRFAPGASYRYSNVDYSLLGAIIEIVTGRPYERYLHDNLFKPASMRKTGYRIPKWGTDELAMGYRKDGSEWGTPLSKAWGPDGPYWHLRANGGILSTVGDLYRWHTALEGERVLSRAAKEKYFAPHVAEGPRQDSFYAYGWVVAKSPVGTNLIMHNGGNGIFFADFIRDQDERAVVIIASNQAAHSAKKEVDVLGRLFYSGLRRN